MVNEMNRHADVSQGDVQCPFVRRNGSDGYLCCALVIGHQEPHEDHGGRTYGEWIMQPAAPNGKRDLDGLREALDLAIAVVSNHAHEHPEMSIADCYGFIAEEIAALAAQRDPKERNQ